MAAARLVHRPHAREGLQHHMCLQHHAHISSSTAKTTFELRATDSTPERVTSACTELATTSLFGSTVHKHTNNWYCN